MLQEARAPLSTEAGRESIWYMKLNPTVEDMSSDVESGTHGGCEREKRRPVLRVDQEDIDLQNSEDRGRRSRCAHGLRRNLTRQRTRWPEPLRRSAGQQQEATNYNSRRASLQQRPDVESSKIVIAEHPPDHRGSRTSAIQPNQQSDRLMSAVHSSVFTFLVRLMVAHSIPVRPFNATQPDLSPIRIRCPRTTEPLLRAFRTAVYVLELYARILHDHHPAGHFVDEFVDSHLHSITLTAVFRHFHVISHAAIHPASPGDRCEYFLLRTHLDPLARLQTQIRRSVSAARPGWFPPPVDMASRHAAAGTS